MNWIGLIIKQVSDMCFPTHEIVQNPGKKFETFHSLSTFSHMKLLTSIEGNCNRWLAEILIFVSILGDHVEILIRKLGVIET